MTDQPDLIKAIRAGNLSSVHAALAADPAHERAGPDGLAMGMACFLGQADIVRALFAHGFVVNLPDNTVTTSPLKMAIRGGRKEIVRQLIELGLDLPEGVPTGLTAQEITVAQWIAFRDGLSPLDERAATQSLEQAVEEIILGRLSGVDTQVLESDIQRAMLHGG
ncbi:MAG: ankyrin repeat domain-containing protein [Dechloromonas sp.]|nr:ankyrin repeat domain-containing protein [Dechloromonas sp.]